MQVANKLMMLSMNVGDMAKSKAFYVKQLGFTIATEYRQDDDNWWVTLSLPENGATLTLSRASVSPQSVKEGTLAVYFETSDVEAAHKDLSSKDIKVDEVQSDLFGPGSGVQWTKTNDPDGNAIFFVQKHDARAPF